MKRTWFVVAPHLSIAAALVGLLVCPAAIAQDGPGQAVDNHLQAGEFAPALHAARQAPAAERDALLARVAQAQAQAGMRRAAFDTSFDIGSDFFRSSAAGSAGGQPVGGGLGRGGRGGGNEPDFESLIELITTTVAPSSWEEAGGPGSIKEFETGVRVDALGKVQSLLRTDVSGRVGRVRALGVPAAHDAKVRASSPLRKVSLTRLERAVQIQLAAGQPLDEEMQLLAGLHKIEYVLVYPETGDVVLAGPAGDWRRDEENRLINAETSRPVLQLDDLVVVLRHMAKGKGEPFGCSIVPQKENLAETKAFLDGGAGRQMPQNKFEKQLREKLGWQSIDYYGIDPQTRVARIMFEADYRMKLVGIGLEPGTLDVPSMLSQLVMEKGQAPPSFGVLRWWFTLNHEAVLATPERDGFEMRGQHVRVQSENEMLTDQGERMHTGKSEGPPAEFAQRFTKHFAELAAKYPIYADLENVFDLALACAIIQSEGLADKASWHMTCFGDPEQYVVGAGNTPKMVESVVNHRNIGRSTVVT
ncbi:MAG: DUF1598 domain-containing protein, partial [Planctomycetia bacterium]|nr:DUF1598 domain-containing protein [Planctomycetia bacterium]